MSNENLLAQVCNIAKEAGEEILSLYKNFSEVSVQEKADKTPVTTADLHAHDIIFSQLEILTPHIPILSEEAKNIPVEKRKDWPLYWAVDPLDGTKEFLARTGEFTVNIALIENGYPIMGVIYAPTLETCFQAYKGLGAQRVDSRGKETDISTNTWEHTEKLVVAVSRHHPSKQINYLLEKMLPHELVHMGSALKFCLVAAGDADLYPCSGRTCEWDTAAGQCIVEEAGGAVMDFEGNRLRYAVGETVYNPSFYVVGDPEHILPVLGENYSE